VRINCSFLPLTEIQLMSPIRLPASSIFKQKTNGKRMCELRKLHECYNTTLVAVTFFLLVLFSNVVIFTVMTLYNRTIRNQCANGLNPTLLINNKKFWEELTAYFPLIRHGPHRKRRLQQFFYCCVSIYCRGNIFTEPLPVMIAGYTCRHTD
jgi:hypothetical protein